MLPPYHIYPHCPLLHLFPSPSFSPSPLPERIQVIAIPPNHTLFLEPPEIVSSWFGDHSAKYIIYDTLCVCWFPRVNVPGYISIRDDPTKTCCSRENWKISRGALARVAQVVGALSCNQKVVCSIASPGMYNPGQGTHGRQPISVSLSPFLSL